MAEVEPEPEQPIVVGAIRHAPPPTIRAERRLLVQEITRASMALTGIVLLFIIVIFAFSRATTWEETRTVLDIFVPVIGALVGACAGFYFADRHHD